MIEAYRYPKVVLFNRLTNTKSVYIWGKLEQQLEMDLSSQKCDYLYHLYDRKNSIKPAYEFEKNTTVGIIEPLATKDWLETSDDVVTVGPTKTKKKPRMHAWDEFIEKSGKNLDGSDYQPTTEDYLPLADRDYNE